MTEHHDEFTSVCIAIVRHQKRAGLLDALATLFEGSETSMNPNDWSDAIGPSAAIMLLLRIKRNQIDDTSRHKDEAKKRFLRLIEVANKETEEYSETLIDLAAHAKAFPESEMNIRMEQIRTVCHANSVLDPDLRKRLRESYEE